MLYGRNGHFKINRKAAPQSSATFTPCLKKACANLFLSELRQISTNFDHFWQKDDKDAKIMRSALIFHLT